VQGALGSRFAVSQMLEQSIPLLIIGLGLCVAFRATVWNIGAEGQFYIGALFGGVVGIYFPVHSPFLVIPLTFVAAMAGGALWAWIAGAMRAHLGVNEIVNTLMLNYIALFILAYLVRIPLRDPERQIIQSRPMQDAAQLPDFPGFTFHIGFVVAILLVPIVAYVLNKTPFGFRISLSGMNRDAAETAGVDSGRTIKHVMMISGALAGLAGIIQVEAVQIVLNTSVSRQFGFTAIVVALLGRTRPVGVLLASLFLGGLAVGGVRMQQVHELPTAIILSIQALFVLLLLAAERLMRR
jgi:simple sugar transport system permease protein